MRTSILKSSASLLCLKRPLHRHLIGLTAAAWLAGGMAAAAQTTPNLALSFSSASTATSTAFASVGDTVKVYLFLNNTAADGNALSIYDTNIGISPSALSFVNFNSGTPFLATSVDFNQGQGVNTASANSGTSVLRESYGSLSSVGVSNHGSTMLGYFEVSVGSIGVGGTSLTLGSASNQDAFTGGSELVDINGNEVLSSVSGVTLLPMPVAAPEPSGLWVLGVGVMLLVGAGWRTRRTMGGAQ